MFTFLWAGVSYFLDPFFFGAPGPLAPHDAVDVVAERAFDDEAVVGGVAACCLGVDVDVVAGVVRGPLDVDAVA